MGRKPVAPKTQLGERLTKVREKLKFPERDPFAQALGLSEAMVGYYERGDRVPDASALAPYNERFGVNLSWLITGKGEMFDTPSNSGSTLKDCQSSDAEVEVFFAVGNMIQEVHETCGVQLPPRALARLARAIYIEVSQSLENASDPDEIKALVDVHRVRLRRELVSAKAEPGTGKRSAS